MGKIRSNDEREEIMILYNRTCQTGDDILYNLYDLISMIQIINVYYRLNTWHLDEGSVKTINQENHCSCMNKHNYPTLQWYI